ICRAHDPAIWTSDCRRPRCAHEIGVGWAASRVFARTCGRVTEYLRTTGVDRIPTRTAALKNAAARSRPLAARRSLRSRRSPEFAERPKRTWHFGPIAWKRAPRAECQTSEFEQVRN